MPNPVYLDGPLEGRQDHPVPQAEIDTGQIVVQRAGMPPVVYTVTRVQVFGKILVVASEKGGLPAQELLFERLVTAQGQAAAE
jgi:hypothetical protein